MNEDDKRKEFSDFIIFIDPDDDKRKEWYVQIIKLNTFLTFKTFDGNTISIPATNVLKIKQRGDTREISSNPD